MRGDEEEKGRDDKLNWKKIKFPKNKMSKKIK
jgi:hypothetical protein